MLLTMTHLWRPWSQSSADAKSHLIESNAKLGELKTDHSNCANLICIHNPDVFHTSSTSHVKQYWQQSLTFNMPCQQLTTLSRRHSIQQFFGRKFRRTLLRWSDPSFTWYTYTQGGTLLQLADQLLHTDPSIVAAASLFFSNFSKTGTKGATTGTRYGYKMVLNTPYDSTSNGAARSMLLINLFWSVANGWPGHRDFSW